MDEIKGIVVYIFGTLLIWSLVIGLIKIFLMITGLYFRMIWTIKLPKRKKFLKKEDPIYELWHSNLSDAYFVRKWILGYVDCGGLNLLSVLLFPYPVCIKEYKYVDQESFLVGGKKSVEELEKPIGEVYEKKYKLAHKAELEDRIIRNEFNNKLNKINKVFNENYTG